MWSPMNNLRPTFTAEALVALAVGYDVAPPPLLLLQLAFDPSTEDATAELFRIIERGSRTLATLHAAIDPSQDLKAELARSVTSMSYASAFVALSRADIWDSRVLYCGDSIIRDVVDDTGNHCPHAGADVASELQEFFGAFDEDKDTTIVVSSDRFTLGAETVEDEDPIISALVSNDCEVRVISLGCPAEGRLEILQWRSTPDHLFAYHVDGNDVVFNSTSTAVAVGSVLSAMEGIQEVIVGSE